MFIPLVILACFATGAHGYWCGVCELSSKQYCCFGNNDSTYCCTMFEYYTGGFLEMQTVIIASVVALAILTVTVCCVCCYCCSCCPCHKRRRQGTVYNSVPETAAIITPPTAIYQPAPHLASPKPYPAQYPPQQPINPYYGHDLPSYNDAVNQTGGVV